ncbi:uncharacterized protein LOC6583329 [Drosophila mojavensis]|uniref:Uncharacterized protein n=1 Tax=Drosophila mojavensis TaxID=7230 RepID=B4KVK4_DROMO|nr:uncharacterized protein LOC6583329 [Drosophila mojavensis]EDW19475.2 uncharacterized protein Dmoj_GI11502 [Drosophila mojavensis]
MIKNRAKPNPLMEPDYNVILMPIISAVLLSYNRPVSLDEIVDGVIQLLSSQREKHSSLVSSSLEVTSDSSYAHIVPAHRRKR